MSDTVVSASPVAVTPGPVWDLVQGLSRYWTAAAAVEVGVFDALASGGADLQRLATVCGAEPQRLAVILDALVAMGLLSNGDGTYHLSPVAATYLVSSEPEYMGDLLRHSPGRARNWPCLARTLRSGVPEHPIDEDIDFWRDIAAATFVPQHRAAQATAAALGLQGVTEPLRVLDVGAGSAPWTVGLLEAMPRATAVVNDLPGVIDLAEQSVQRYGLADRVTLRAGDHRRVDLPQGVFDLVVLANVVRTEGRAGARTLLHRGLGWLRPGGRLLVAEYFTDAGTPGALAARLLGVTMVANTRTGATYSSRTYRDWLAAAGLGPADLLRPAPGTEVLVARRPDQDGHG